MLANALPIYASGIDTGIVVDCGFQQVEILPWRSLIDGLSALEMERPSQCIGQQQELIQGLSQIARKITNQRARL